MKTNSIKRSVVETYSKLALSNRKGIFSHFFAYCNSTDNANHIAEVIGYSQSEMNAVPESANLGVGCGNPSAFSKIKENDIVIDLGSGAGFDAFIVSKIIGDKGKVIGVDLSDEMINLANKNAIKGKYNNVDFVKGDIEDLPLEDQIADHIISNCVINLSLNKKEVYKEAYRVLKEGGKLAISDIVLEKELPDFVKKSLAAHIACISGAEKLEDYLQYINDAGFKNIKVEKRSKFPIELMMTDPQIKKIADEMNFDLNSSQASDIASSVSSVSISANK